MNSPIVKTHEIAGGDTILDEIGEFLTVFAAGLRQTAYWPQFYSRTFVGATERAASLGDRRWHDLLDHHHTVVGRGGLAR